jgi:single-stranded-DNA-specific exonuclease
MFVTIGHEEQDTKYIHGAKYLWMLPKDYGQNMLELASHYNISTPIIQTLLGRGFSTKDDIYSFLVTSYDAVVPQPELMADAIQAVERLRVAIEQGQCVLVFGDYDVDGMAATSLVMYCLLVLGAKVNFYLPNRMFDGYGLSVTAVQKAARNGYHVIITVDNGMTAFEAAEEAKKLGIDLIITDHHRPSSKLPQAYAIVNPMRADCQYPCKYLAGVGVAFKVMSLLFQEFKRQIPDKVYELLALGTIADVVPLKDENRYWVRHGMAYINKNMSLPIQVLKQNNNLEKEYLSSLDIGFSIAPQLNALGRLSDPRRAIPFLIGSDSRVVAEVGSLLFQLNETRKHTERTILYDVQAAIDKKRIDISTENIIMASHPAWPVGVIGLVASRLVAMYGKPTLLFHHTKDGLLKGSGRSIPAFNLFEALDENADILCNYGGHSAAAGLSLSVDKVGLLKERLEKSIAERLTPFDLQQKLILDATVQLTELSRKFIADMSHLEPFGHENEQPLFYIRDVVQVQKPGLLKDQHVKCHVFADGVVKPVIFFNRPELYQVLLDCGEQPFDLAAYVVENCWNGRVTVELQGVDISIGNT